MKNTGSSIVFRKRTKKSHDGFINSLNVIPYEVAQANIVATIVDGEEVYSLAGMVPEKVYVPK